MEDIKQAVDELKTSALSRIEALEKGIGKRLDLLDESVGHLEKVTGSK